MPSRSSLKGPMVSVVSEYILTPMTPLSIRHCIISQRWPVESLSKHFECKSLPPFILSVNTFMDLDEHPLDLLGY